MIPPDDIPRYATAFPEVEETTHFRRSTFKGKLFAGVEKGHRTAVVPVSQQAVAAARAGEDRIAAVQGRRRPRGRLGARPCNSAALVWLCQRECSTNAVGHRAQWQGSVAYFIPVNPGETGDLPVVPQAATTLEADRGEFFRVQIAPALFPWKP